MDTQIIIVLVLNFLISIIGTLAYSVRLVGVRTGKIAVTFAVFNVLMLVSRTAVTFQVPLLTKFVESNSSSNDLLKIFNYIILVSGIASIVGAILIPTFQRMFSKAVDHFSIERSIPKLIIHSFSKTGIKYMKDSIAIPVKESVTSINFKNLPRRILFYNFISVAIITAGAFAPIYAGSLVPEFSTTCLALAPIINGTATILTSIFIDPHLSIMTDDVIDGKCSEEDFRGCIIGMVGSKIVGTFTALALFIPASYIIVFVANYI
ncbi:MAG: lipid II flippase Amj family protein [Clostridium sp.]|uniref:lipid II flippase Amj family protein n=1 Tax=Clostridium sp. TaxID=1506 RepID=UPI002908D6D4|nr:lipid II flippase Amj family protein [Clostridium sp.]MDU5111997.1 lipid II flippase Amj family protein [Clostridium sp.]